MFNCLVITDGNAGARSQALGLAEALNVKYQEKIFKLPFWLRPFAPYFAFNYLKFKTHDSSTFSDIVPKLIIVCGSSARSIGPFYKRKLGNKIFTIYIQDPKISPKFYDLIIAPKHDKIYGNNVIHTNFALNRVNEQKLTDAVKKYKDLFKNYTKPFFTILIGGTTKKYKMTHEAISKLICDVNDIVNNNHGSFLITPSRRTPSAAIENLQKLFGNKKNIYIYNLKDPDNPFFAMLGLAKKIFVTNDSISMISETCATKKQVFIIPLLHFKTKKALSFVQNLLSNNLVALFNSANPKFKKLSQNETQMIANKVKKIINQKRNA
jgi:mitochondrial fission protein ELM1